MLKQSIFVLIASVIIVLLAHEVSYLLFWLDGIHHFVTEELARIFSGGYAGSIIRKSIALFIVPFVIALIPWGIYYAIKRSSLEYFPHVLWICWIILATILILK